MKRLQFQGNSEKSLRRFPLSVQQDALLQLFALQNGREPNDWRPISSVGAGVNEIRIRDVRGAFRVMYVAKFKDAIYVLHCFQKKSQKTSPLDIRLARNRYDELMKEMSS